MRRMSESGMTKGSGVVAPSATETDPTKDKGTFTEISQMKRLSTEAIAEIVPEHEDEEKLAEAQSSSSEEPMDGEGRMAIKDIEKLTSGHLDIKPLNLDMNTMRRFVHTPKNGVRLPLDVSPFMNSLSSKGFLLFDPSNRPAQVYSKLENE